MKMNITHKKPLNYINVDGIHLHWQVAIMASFFSDEPAATHLAYKYPVNGPV